MGVLAAPKAVLFMCLLRNVQEPRKSVYISGPVWKTDVHSCYSSGQNYQLYTFPLPTLPILGLTYDDFDELTTVIAIFEHFELSTKAVKDAKFEQTMLYNYVKHPSYKTYYGVFGYTAKAGWASQVVSYNITFMVFESSRLQLDVKVDAGSWGALSCATASINISKLRVIY